MAHIPSGDIQELWNDTKEHSWKALHKTLEQHQGKAEGISNNLVDMMLNITDRMEKEGKAYPNSTQQLYDVLNDQVSHQHP